MAEIFGHHVLIFVTCEQEAAIRHMFREKSWSCLFKVMTDEIVLDLIDKGFQSMFPVIGQDAASSILTKIKTEVIHENDDPDETKQLVSVCKDSSDTSTAVRRSEIAFLARGCRYAKTHARIIDKSNATGSTPSAYSAIESLDTKSNSDAVNDSSLTRSTIQKQSAVRFAHAKINTSVLNKKKLSTCQLLQAKMSAPVKKTTEISRLSLELQPSDVPNLTQSHAVVNSSAIMHSSHEGVLEKTKAIITDDRVSTIAALDLQAVGGHVLSRRVGDVSNSSILVSALDLRYADGYKLHCKKKSLDASILGSKEENVDTSRESFSALSLVSSENQILTNYETFAETKTAAFNKSSLSVSALVLSPERTDTVCKRSQTVLADNKSSPERLILAKIEAETYDKKWSRGSVLDPQPKFGSKISISVEEPLISKNILVSNSNKSLLPTACYQSTDCAKMTEITLSSNTENYAQCVKSADEPEESETDFLHCNSLEDSALTFQSTDGFTVVKTEAVDFSNSCSELSANDLQSADRPELSESDAAEVRNSRSRASAFNSKPAEGSDFAKMYSNLSSMFLAAHASSVCSRREENVLPSKSEKGAVVKWISLPSSLKAQSADERTLTSSHIGLKNNSKLMLAALAGSVCEQTSANNVNSLPGNGEGDISAKSSHIETSGIRAVKRKYCFPVVNATVVRAINDYKKNVQDVAVARFIEKQKQLMDKRTEEEQKCSEYHKIKCVDCPRKFKNRIELWKHRNEVKHQLPAIRPPTKIAQQIFTSEELEQMGFFKCFLCNNSYPDRKKLRKHVSGVHKNSMPYYACPVCGEEFQRFDELLQHKREKQHSDSMSSLESLQCDICGKHMTKYASLVQHQRLSCGKSEEENAALRIHPCDVCGKKFKSAGFMKAHQRVVHVNDPEVCDVCGTVCKNRAALQAHKIRHDESNRRFSCSECGKAFYGKSTLKMHMRTHTKEKPFKCPLCDYASSVKHNVPKHAKAVHKTTVTVIDLTK